MTGAISSREEVDLRVNISGSAGAFLTDHGDIKVTIPKEIVYNSNDFIAKTVILQPFKLEKVTNDALNYYLTFSIDRTAIGDNDAFNGIFEIKFGAPLMTVGDAYHDTQTFMVDYAGQSKNVTVDVQKQNVAIAPLFDKWYKGDFDKDGVATLNTVDSENNSFQLVVNYRRIDLQNVVITDTLPKGTSLIASPTKSSISGDTMTKDGIRILKVMAFDAAGTATKYQYVTADFQDKIHVDKETNRFTVELGDLTVDGLDPWTYAFVETAAPKGYMLNSDAVSFEIKFGENDGVVEVVKENSHVFTQEPVDPVVPEPEIPIKPEVPVNPGLPVESESPVDLPKAPIEKPIVKPEIVVTSKVKQEKLVKTGDQSDKQFILLGCMLLGATLLWYRKV